jgi:anhydro-N-acetylmuramic acid kinase
MVIDALVREETGGAMQFDAGGAIAAGGHACEELVEAIISADSYYKRVPPKSTGREVYGAAFAARFREEGRRRGLSFADLVASATALTAATIVRSYRDFIFPKYPIGDVIAAGGGAHNETLLAMMRRELPPSCRLSTSEQFGIPDDAREAIAFAVIGHESLMGRPSNLPAVTGASRAVILGNLTL